MSPIHNIHLKNHGIFYVQMRTKTTEDDKITFYNIMKTTHLEGIPLVRKVFVFFSLQSIFWTFSLGESHCAAANSKKRLFGKSALESGSKAFFVAAQSVIEIFDTGTEPHAIPFSLMALFFTLCIFSVLYILFSLRCPSISHLYSFTFVVFLAADLVASIIHANADVKI